VTQLLKQEPAVWGSDKVQQQVVPSSALVLSRFLSHLVAGVPGLAVVHWVHHTLHLHQGDGVHRDWGKT
jgi:hypothetical protein